LLDLSSEKSIYIQVAEIIENEILLGNINEGDQAPSTNQFAKIYNIQSSYCKKGLKSISRRRDTL